VRLLAEAHGGTSAGVPLRGLGFCCTGRIVPFYPGVGPWPKHGQGRREHAVDIAIAGGGAAGLFAGLLLARAGHQIVVLERDCLQPAPDVESAAAAAFRPSAPQIVQPHIVMARCRQLLIERLPDVYAGLLAAGVAEAPLRTQMPDSLSDTAARPGDERLTPMMTRRSTVDWVLRRAAAAEPRVTVRSGVKVTGLLTAAGRSGGRVPHVTGVRTDRGDLAADLVVDATGRRSPIDDWLTRAGARTTATWRAECGIAYFSRHYRVRPGAGLPALLVTRIVMALDEFLAGKWGGDNGAVQLVVAPLAADHRFRTARDPRVFTAVLRTVPTYASWLDVMDPITGVFPMAGLHNTLRRLVVDGNPVATGLHAIGDSVCTTNPTLGRGLALALSGAADLADAIGEHAADPAAQALALDRLADVHVVPFYHDQAAIDAARLAMMRHTIFGAPPPPASETPGRVTYAQLRAAASYDPAAFRAFWTINGMVCPPEEVYTDPDVVAATRQTLRRHGTAPPVAQPTREQLRTALAL
jgi:2-polyprenyl-6-methoxyphenol hydroxylase-like FAD-dependent oxidoreductase